MATVDYTYKALNNQKRITNGTVGQVTFTMEGGTTITSGDILQICVIPKGTLITSATLIKDVAFDSAISAVVNIGINGGSATAFGSALDVKTATGVVNLTAGQYFETGAIVNIVPTLVGTTTVGTIRFVVDYIETRSLSGEYNA